MDRRRFLQTSAVAAAGLVLSRGASFAAGGPKERQPAEADLFVAFEVC